MISEPPGEAGSKPSEPADPATLPTLERIQHDVEQIADLPVELRRAIELLRRQSFSGPLPPPEILEGYKAAYSEAPAIIFGELTSQGKHRRDLESTALNRQERRADRGQVFALVIVLAVLLVGVLAVIEDQGWVAVALFGTALASIVGLFIYGTRRQVADLTNKRERLERMLRGPSDENGDPTNEGPSRATP